MSRASLTTVLLLGFLGLGKATPDCCPPIGCGEAVPAIRITSLFQDNKKNFTEKFQVKAKANTNYWVKLIADDGKGNITTLEQSLKITTDAKGQASGSYNNTASTFTVGATYKFTASLYPTSDTTGKGVSDSQSYKIGDPEAKFPGLFDECCPCGAAPRSSLLQLASRTECSMDEVRRCSF